MAFIWKNKEIRIECLSGNGWIHNIYCLIDSSYENEKLNVKNVFEECEVVDKLQTCISRFLNDFNVLPQIGMKFTTDKLEEPFTVVNVNMDYNNIIIIGLEFILE